jgi:hypothetical protein
MIKMSEYFQTKRVKYCECNERGPCVACSEWRQVDEVDAKPACFHNGIKIEIKSDKTNIILDNLVTELKEHSDKEGLELLDNEVNRLIDLMSYLTDYDKFLIKDGEIKHATSQCVQMHNILSKLEDGKYIRFSMSRNNFVDLDDFIDRVEDYFYLITTCTEIEEFITKVYYVFYIKFV